LGLTGLFTRAQWVRRLCFACILRFYLLFSTCAVGPEVRATMGEVARSRDQDGRIGDLLPLSHEIYERVWRRKLFELSQVTWLIVLAAAPMRRSRL
jgi:hypothetical protein